VCNLQQKWRDNHGVFKSYRACGDVERILCAVKAEETRQASNMPSLQPPLLEKTGLCEFVNLLISCSWRHFPGGRGRVYCFKTNL